MSTSRPRRIAHFAGGGSFAQGLPTPTPATGYTPGPQSSAAGSWGAGAEAGGIPGDTNVSPVGAPPAWTGGPSPGDYVAPPAPMPANVGNQVNAPESSSAYVPGQYGSMGSNIASNSVGGFSFAKGGAIPDKVEHFKRGGRSGHGAYKVAGTPPPPPQQEPDTVAAHDSGVYTRGSEGDSHNAHPDASGYDPATGYTVPGSTADKENQGVDDDEKGGMPKPGMPKMGGQGGSQSAAPGGPGGWNGGLDSLPSASPAAAANPAAGGPTDAMGSPGAGGASSALPAGSDAAQGGIPLDAMGAPGMSEGGSVQPKEEPYREKWRAKSGQKQAPYRAFDDGGQVPTDNAQGAIPDSPDIPVQQDQGQQGQAGDPMANLAAVKQALTYTRQQFGLSDNAFKMATDKLAGNIPAKPAGSGGDQQNMNPFPTMTPKVPFGKKTSQADDSDSDEADA